MARESWRYSTFLAGLLGKGARFLLRCAGADARIACACAVAAALLAAPSRADDAPAPSVLVLVNFDLIDVSQAVASVSIRESASEQTRENLLAALRENVALSNRFTFEEWPAASPDEQLIIRNHVAAAVHAARQGLTLLTSDDAVWAYLREGLPYSVGPGLAFLADHSRADTALIVVGHRVRQSTGRVLGLSALAIGTFFTPAPGILGLPTIGVSSYALAVLLDLRTGRLRWASSDTGFLADPTHQEDAKRLIDKLFAGYPLKPVRDSNGH
ncbi:MAG: hypothetical protein JSR73_08080 [Proteobacteria bacterium]|nr:hypothetical protein [Pseudomonadota bacterium]